MSRALDAAAAALTPAPPLCNDCAHYIKQSPGFCRRLALREVYPSTLRQKIDSGRLDPAWRSTRERCEGQCGLEAKMFWADNV
jgi:hypothetical protein